MLIEGNRKTKKMTAPTDAQQQQQQSLCARTNNRGSRVLKALEHEMYVQRHVQESLRLTHHGYIILNCFVVTTAMMKHTQGTAKRLCFAAIEAPKNRIFMAVL